MYLRPGARPYLISGGARGRRQAAARQRHQHYLAVGARLHAHARALGSAARRAAHLQRAARAVHQHELGARKRHVRPVRDLHR